MGHPDAQAAARRTKIVQVAILAIAAVMLLLSFMMLLVINVIQAWSRRRYGYGA